MTSKGKAVIVGSFVIGALVLLTLALMVLGGGRFFEDRRTFVTYFDGSLKGLRVGSNVLFRGVRVGFVTDIRVEADPDIAGFRVPVTFQIIPEAVALVDPDDRLLSYGTTPPRLAELIERGLRTRLELESIVTGQLVIQLDFFPDTPATFRGRRDGPPEIPSAPSDIQEVIERVQTFVTELQARINVDDFVRRVESTLDGIDRLVRSEDLSGALAGINQLANSAELQALPGTALQTLAAAEQAMDELQQLIAAAESRFDPVLEGADAALEQLAATLREAGGVLEAARLQLGEESEINFQLNRTLREAEAAARSLRLLADYLERNPEALLRGRRGGEP
ncbi:MAG: MCE family protein [Chromatiales bacterium]|nr:MCE family protein [Chromatiales bacterium]